MRLDWNLSDPPEAAVFTTRGVLDGAVEPVRIIRDEEGDWQAIPPGERRDDDAVVVCLADLVALSNAIREAVRELDSRPRGTQARRRDGGWEYAPHELRD